MRGVLDSKLSVSLMKLQTSVNDVRSELAMLKWRRIVPRSVGSLCVYSHAALYLSIHGTKVKDV